MSNWLARLLLLVLAPQSLALILPATRAPARTVAAALHFDAHGRAAEDLTVRVLGVRMQDLPAARVLGVRMQDLPPPPQPEDEEDSLYNADFSFDATTVVALLGAAIAFNFFVLANL
jgi:hypothetical protein